MLRDVLASLRRQSERTARLESDLLLISSQYSAVQGAVTQIASLVTRLSSSEESVRQLNSSVSTLHSSLNAHSADIDSHSRQLTQHALTTKELQTSSTLLLSLLDTKATTAELDKKASATKLAQVERLQLLHSKEVDELRERVNTAMLDFTDVRERVHDSQLQRERLTEVDRDLQAVRGELADMRHKEDNLQSRIDGCHTRAEVDDAIAAMEAKLLSTSKDLHSTAKKEFRRFERDVVAYINANSSYAGPALPSSPSPPPAPSHPGGQLRTGLAGVTPLSLPPASYDPDAALSSLPTAAAAIIHYACLSCSTHSTAVLPQSPPPPPDTHRPLTSRPTLPPATLLSTGDTTWVTGTDGNMYRGDPGGRGGGGRPRTAEGVRGGRGGGGGGDGGGEWREEKEEVDGKESLVFAEETRRRKGLEGGSGKEGGGGVSRLRPQRLMVNGSGQLVKAPAQPPPSRPQTARR